MWIAHPSLDGHRGDVLKHDVLHFTTETQITRQPVTQQVYNSKTFMCIWEGKLHFQKEANWRAKSEWWMMFTVWASLYLRLMSNSAWELQCHHPVPIYLHWLMMSSADDLFVSELVWVCLCFISTRLITHLWLRINLTKALAMTPTSALGAKWKYNWATAITTYRQRERLIMVTAEWTPFFCLEVMCEKVSLSQCW